MDHERFEKLMGAYVLGTLPEEERREFARYLAARPERQAVPNEYGPPPELRGRIMGVVRAEAERGA